MRYKLRLWTLFFHITHSDTKNVVTNSVRLKRSSNICWAPDSESSNFVLDNRFPRKNVKAITVFTTHYPLVDLPPVLQDAQLALIHWKMVSTFNWFPSFPSERQPIMKQFSSYNRHYSVLLVVRLSPSTAKS